MALLLRKILKIIKAYFIIIGVLTTLAFLSLTLLIKEGFKNVSTQEEHSESLKEQSLIHLKWDGVLREGRENENPFNLILGGYLNHEKNLYTPYVESYLKELAEDPLVKGLFIELGSLQSDLTLLSELREALKKFKDESKKPIYFWLTRTDTRGYYLASIGDEIVMPPTGTLHILGPMVNSIYFGEALRKIGVGVEVIKNGSYKASLEPFVRNSPSKESLVMYKALEASIRKNLVYDLQNSPRDLKKEDIESAFKISLFTAKEALSRKLVTELSYLHEVKKKYKEKHKAKLFPFTNYLAPKKDHRENNTSEGIALIEAIGKIQMTSGSGGAITPESMTEKLTWAREEKSIKAVVLRISSPGGDALASDLIWEEVRRLSEVKPLVVSMGSSAASGGYYIAAPAHKIFASPYTLTGSIGVISLIANFKEFEDKYGISFFLYSQSERKALLSMGEGASAEDKKLLRKHSSATYHDFLTKVSQGRKMSYDDVLASAEGQIWTGSQAKDRKLVDTLGGLKEALEEAKKLAGFKEGDHVPVFYWEPEIKSLQDCFRNSDAMKKCFSYGRASVRGQLLQEWGQIFKVPSSLFSPSLLSL